MNRKRLQKVTILLLICCMAAPLYGLSAPWSKPKPAVDTDADRVYRYVTAEKLLAEFARNKDEAIKEYKCVLVTGVLDIEQTRFKTTYYLKGTSGGARVEIDFGFWDQAKDTILDSGDLRDFRTSEGGQDGTAISVLGMATVDVFGTLRISYESWVPAVPEAGAKSHYVRSEQRDADRYPTVVGIDRDPMQERYLYGEDGKLRATYRIPAAWKGVEHDIQAEGLGCITGYQYALNHLPGYSDQDVEAFFVCYFDRERVFKGYRNKPDQEIREAIIANIAGRDLDGRLISNYKVKDHFTTIDDEIPVIDGGKVTYYDAEYYYYFGPYAQKYYSEYILQKDGDRGWVLYVYIYNRSPRDLSDVLFVTRFLELAK